jgi:hypothetical protein
MILDMILGKSPGGSGDELYTLHPWEVRYSFLGKHVMPRTLADGRSVPPLVDAPALAGVVLEPEGVYARTPEGFYKLVGFRAVASFMERLQCADCAADGHCPVMLFAHHGTAYRLWAVSIIELGNKTPRIGFPGRFPREYEWLLLSEERLRELREHVVLPRRGTYRIKLPTGCRLRGAGELSPAPPQIGG